MDLSFATTRSVNRTALEARWARVLPTETGPRSWCQPREWTSPPTSEHTIPFHRCYRRRGRGDLEPKAVYAAWRQA
jgi:hypothetical protein